MYIYNKIFCTKLLKIGKQVSNSVKQKRGFI